MGSWQFLTVPQTEASSHPWIYFIPAFPPCDPHLPTHQHCPECGIADLFFIKLPNVFVCMVSIGSEKPCRSTRTTLSHEPYRVITATLRSRSCPSIHTADGWMCYYHTNTSIWTYPGNLRWRNLNIMRTERKFKVFSSEKTMGHWTFFFVWWF